MNTRRAFQAEPFRFLTKSAPSSTRNYHHVLRQGMPVRTALSRALEDYEIIGNDSRRKVDGITTMVLDQILARKKEMSADDH